MATVHLVPPDIHELYEVREWRNAVGVLTTSCESEWYDILAMLRQFKFFSSQILGGGGNKSKVASGLDRFLSDRGWREKEFDTKVLIDGVAYESPTHKVDCFKNRVALEIEWNNKDPFFDRDLNNFRLLFELRAIDVGVIVTRSSKLQSLFSSFGKKIAGKYGMATTHMNKLIPRIEGGGGGGCPVIAFAITDKSYIHDGFPTAALTGDDENEE
jgi:hypothetical protein